MNIVILRNELLDDPLSRSYSGMNHSQAATSLNTKNRPGPERTVVPAYEIWESVVPAEWASLNAQEKQRVQTILGMGQVNIKGANTRNALGAVFGVGTTTRSNLLLLQAGPQISRAEELGLGVVGDGHVQSARENS